MRSPSGNRAGCEDLKKKGGQGGKLGDPKRMECLPGKASGAYRARRKLNGERSAHAILSAFSFWIS
jgi:hypothetical protein